MKLNIDYENAIDFEHCESMDEASKRLSQITNLLNRVISVRNYSKNKILEECSSHPNERFHKLSWDNKLVRLLSISDDVYVKDIVDMYCESDTAYKQLKNKQDQVVEDLMKLKKQIEVTPR